MPEDGRIYTDPQTGATIFDDGERPMTLEDDTPITVDGEGRGSAFAIPDEPTAPTPQPTPQAPPVAAAPVVAQPVPGSPPPPPPAGDLVAQLQAQGVTSAGIHQRIASAVQAAGPEEGQALAWLENAGAIVQARALATELEKRERLQDGLALAKEHPEIFGLHRKAAAPAPPAAPAKAAAPAETLSIEDARFLGLA